ncbi:cell wall metabolism sensor histidine kinase WalK [Caldibacillus thermolactis]|jgi:two-component system, OmpR family, sensor histidine kinase ResE|uniref:histidine kinase n=1 Tax=Pallidibacillus thermolactis TaxID=251051 RepID=A0ABT2WKY8_9BACI|nr:ATP-binding protein [Pallidibacillus thermolactis]MCU9595379.1 cell wall metabolism sensor histidine kinase WalK [Pallidibacillus thermolactis]MCU9602676.1 cell wall metabolism sensor histidine kinase WalK [Pallidibacillus thermolactis subsp. kokeshiiformis]MED1674098.1 ATP-binding protein [Pallidibacillus thermolactis subsp. kokeshiiformis]
MKRWNSVVGKLWATILLLMFVVLFVLSILIMQFFQSYVVEDVKKSLIDTASQIAKTLEEHDEFSFALEVAWEILDENTHAIIITDENHIYHSNPEDKKIFDINYFKSDKTLSQVFTIDDSVTKEIEFTQSDEKLNQGLMIGVPIHLVNKTGAVFIYQSLDVMDNAIEATSDIILWSAGIAFILTSAFAFFLSTRVTAPLRKMRESAAEVAKGRFDVKVPILTHDEIGELAKTFNKMREQLEVNMNALKREKEQLSSILRSMADGVITINKQGEILVTNPPADEFLSAWTDSQDNKGKKEIPPEFIDLLNESIKTGKDQSGEMNFGDRYWSFIVSPQFDEQSIRGAVVVIRDMTEERKLEKMRKDFVANVSHELRTPVAMLQGYSEALIDDIAGNEEERKEIIKIINEESLRMGRLVNELLDLARLESGSMSLTFDDVQLNSYIERIGRKFFGLAKENNVHLEVQVNTDKDIYRFDPDRIEQVLTNLIDNAIRHTPEEGLVELKVTSGQNGLILEIKDNGSGIPSEDLPFVFERFYKADKARTRGSSGTGLGLAIAKNIIDAHKGTISVWSELGKGTVFTINLPEQTN